MKIRVRLLIIAASILLAAAVPALVFFSRTPVLIVTDELFVSLHGKNNLLRQRRFASVALFRQVRPVMVADGASVDMVILAATEAAPEPYCVLFPRYQAAAAVRFHEQLPEIPVVVLRGLVAASDLPSPAPFFSVYGTDRETDLYRAGLCAGLLGETRQKPEEQAELPAEIIILQRPAAGNYVLWQDRMMPGTARDLFSRGVREQKPEAAIAIVRNASEMPGEQNISALVLAGAGAEYLDKSPAMPIILFSWMDPAFCSREIAVLFDDSVWALAVPAVQMAIAGRNEGSIPSRPILLTGKAANSGITQSLKKLVKKVP